MGKMLVTFEPVKERSGCMEVVLFVIAAIIIGIVSMCNSKDDKESNKTSSPKTEISSSVVRSLVNVSSQKSEDVGIEPVLSVPETKLELAPKSDIEVINAKSEPIVVPNDSRAIENVELSKKEQRKAKRQGKRQRNELY